MSDEETSIQPLEADMDKLILAIKEKGKTLEPNCIENANPKKAAHALWLFSQGKSKRKVREEAGVGLETLYRLIDNHEETIEPIRKKYAKSWLHLEHAAHEAMFKQFEQFQDDPELLHKISPDRLALMAGIAQDKAMTLEGEATSVVEHRNGKSMEDALETIKRAKAKVAENKVIDIESEEA